MFKITLHDIKDILNDYGIKKQPISLIELERYYYEKYSLESKEVRLIVKVGFSDAESIVIRFKNENGITLELVEEQCLFAVLLKQNGVETPTIYKTKYGYANWYSINNYNVIITIEQFVEGELQCVNTDIARKTGELLAKMHNIAENADVHIKNDVLFNPFKKNDLFTYSTFKKNEKEIREVDSYLYTEIVSKYEEYMQKLSIIQEEPQYAVQGDISNCNLYLSKQNQIGIFDFNNSGDNYLFCDVIMQAVFEAKLMDYPTNYSQNHEIFILSAFLQSYHNERPFLEMHQKMYPYLYAIINAFWSADIKWNEDSLLKEIEKKNTQGIYRWLQEIYKRINFLPEIPLY